ncbi:VWA domain-containing protein [Dongia sp.]|uniref:VWA domain-containing protein n=1 Tax=Dongia sp. TaxID=1977262 RepID=UPI0037522894
MSEHGEAARPPLKLDLNKAAQSLRLSLDKAGVAQNIKAELIFDIDVSGSFEHEHEEGTTSQLIERLVPYGMVLDPDGAMDVFTFSDGRGNAHRVGTVTPKESEGYILENVVDRVPGWKGGTSYSYVLEKNLQHFGWLPCETDHETGLGALISRFFGGARKEPHYHEQKRSIVIFVTDGENEASDERRTMQVLEASQSRGDNVYFLFIGACEHNVDFKFLKTIAKKFENTGVVIIRDLEAFVEKSDEEISAELLGPELISWLKS